MVEDVPGAEWTFDGWRAEPVVPMDDGAPKLRFVLLCVTVLLNEELPVLFEDRSCGELMDGEDNVRLPVENGELPKVRVEPLRVLLRVLLLKLPDTV